MEYTVKGPSFFRHNISKYAAAADTLYTYNAVCPEDRWDTLKVLLLLLMMMMMMMMVTK